MVRGCYHNRFTYRFSTSCVPCRKAACCYGDFLPGDAEGITYGSSFRPHFSRWQCLVAQDDSLGDVRIIGIIGLVGIGEVEDTLCSVRQQIEGCEQFLGGCGVIRNIETGSGGGECFRFGGGGITPAESFVFTVFRDMAGEDTVFHSADGECRDLLSGRVVVAFYVDGNPGQGMVEAKLHQAVVRSGSLVHQRDGGKKVGLCAFGPGRGIFDDGRSALCTAGYAETARVVWSVSEETQFVRRVVGPVFQGRVRPGGAAFGACHLLIAHEVRGVRFLHVSAARIVSIYAYGGEIVCGQSVVSGLPRLCRRSGESYEEFFRLQDFGRSVACIAGSKQQACDKDRQVSCARYTLGFVHWSMFLVAGKRHPTPPGLCGEVYSIVTSFVMSDQFSTLASSILISCRLICSV